MLGEPENPVFQIIPEEIEDQYLSNLRAEYRSLVNEKVNYTAPSLKLSEIKRQGNSAAYTAAT